MTDEPQSAADYDDRTNTVVRSVLVEIGQTVGSFRGKFAVIDGVALWIPLKDSEISPCRHPRDIDLSLDAQALAVDDEALALVDALRQQPHLSLLHPSFTSVRPRG